MTERAFTQKALQDAAARHHEATGETVILRLFDPRKSYSVTMVYGVHDTFHKAQEAVSLLAELEMDGHIRPVLTVSEMITYPVQEWCDLPCGVPSDV